MSKLFLFLSVYLAVVSAEWYIAMKANQGVSPGAYSMFSAGVPVNAGDSSLLTFNKDTKNYLSYQGAYWPQALICQVRVSMYKGGAEQAYITFDARNVGRMDWFKQSGIVSTTYSDLKTATNLLRFSMEGYASINRHFYIQQNHGGCAVDSGWWVETNHGGCSWDNAVADPGYLYSTLATQQLEDQMVATGGLADLMMISIRTLTPLQYEDPFPLDPYGWSFNTYESTSDGAIHGLLRGSNVLSREFLLQTPHSAVRVEFRFWATDSWDTGEYGYFKIDGVQVGANFGRPADCLASGGNQYTGGSFPNPHGGDHPTSTSHVCYYERSEEVTHTAESLTLSFGATTDQIASDEAYAVNRLKVYTIGCVFNDYYGPDVFSRDDLLLSAGQDSDPLIRGRYHGGEKVSTSFRLQSHSQVTIGFRFWGFDSWDAERGYMSVDGSTKWTSVARPHNACPSPWVFAGTNIIQAAGIHHECYVDVTVTVPHSSSSITIEFSANLNEHTIANEAYGFNRFQFACGTALVPRASVHGDPIYQTFDGLEFEYMGLCPVLLTKDCVGERFSVVSHNTQCGRKSCVEQLVLNCRDSVHGGVSSVSLFAGPDVVLNNENLNVHELYLTNKVVRVGGLSVSAKLSHHENSGSFIVVNASCDAGVSIRWTGKHWGMSSIDVTTKEPLCGLMGNKNGNALDDVRFRSGRFLSVGEEELVEGRYQNESAILDWVWDWVVGHEQLSKEQCMSISESELSQKQCGDAERVEGIERMCRRMLAVVPEEKKCAKLDLDQMIAKCTQMTCSCFNLPKKMLSCVQWSVRELVNECNVTPELRAPSDTGVGFIY